MLDGLIDCIKECKSLYTKAGMLQRDVSIKSHYIWGRLQSILAIIFYWPWPCNQRAAQEALGGWGKDWYKSVYVNRGALRWATFLYAQLWIIFLTAVLDFHSLQRIRKEQRPATCKSFTSGIMPFQKNWLFLGMRFIIWNVGTSFDRHLTRLDWSGTQIFSGQAINVYCIPRDTYPQPPQ